jgi:predicted transcriptional regulator
MMHGMEPSRRTMLADRLRHPPATHEAALLISIKPRYADLIERGEKRVEFRRRFPSDWSSGRAYFYVTSPVRALAFSARISAVTRAAPAQLWAPFRHLSGATRAAFDDYFAGAHTGVALLLEDVHRLASAIPLDDPRLQDLSFRPPQSLMVLPPASALLDLLNSSADPRPAPDRPSW